jgi:hypothetical protein
LQNSSSSHIHSNKASNSITISRRIGPSLTLPQSGSKDLAAAAVTAAVAEAVTAAVAEAVTAAA